MEVAEFAEELRKMVLKMIKPDCYDHYEKLWALIGVLSLELHKLQSALAEAERKYTEGKI